MIDETSTMQNEMYVERLYVYEIFFFCFPFPLPQRCRVRGLW